MTLIASWIRSYGNSQELIFASDSRLTGGETWDCCPKIFQLKRGDAVLCFAGYTGRAFPLIFQIINASEMHDKVSSRAMDITDLKGHIHRISNSMFNQIVDFPTNTTRESMADFNILLGGYSWVNEKFYVWNLKYNRKSDRLEFERIPRHVKQTKGSKRFYFVGDHSKEASVFLYKLLHERKKLTVGGLDLEPFEILCKMINDDKYPSIGGPPQLVKVYKHMNTLPINVLCGEEPNKTKTLLGRRLLDYEVNKYLTIDPETLKITTPYEK